MIYRYGPTTVHTAASNREERAFIEACIADLNNAMPMLVYADWLDEQGDPRGEFLRWYALGKWDWKEFCDKRVKYPVVWRHMLGMEAAVTLFDPEFPDMLETDITAEELRHHCYANARPALRIVGLEPDGEPIPPGSSRHGGRPDLPPGHAWPVFTDRDRYNQSREPSGIFCLQLCLSDLAETIPSRELPATGLMSIVVAHYASDCLINLYPSDTAWQQPKVPEIPADIAEHYSAYWPLKPRRLHIVEGLELPRGDYKGEYISELFEGWSSGSFYKLLCDCELLKNDYDTGEKIVHELLGYGSPPNGGHERAELPSTRQFARFDSDMQTMEYWGDSGTPHLFIDAEDLKTHRFDQIFSGPG